MGEKSNEGYTTQPEDRTQQGKAARFVRSELGSPRENNQEILGWFMYLPDRTGRGLYSCRMTDIEDPNMDHGRTGREGRVK